MVCRWIRHLSDYSRFWMNWFSNSHVYYLKKSSVNSNCVFNSEFRMVMNSCNMHDIHKYVWISSKCVCQWPSIPHMQFPWRTGTYVQQVRLICDAVICCADIVIKAVGYEVDEYDPTTLSRWGLPLYTTSGIRYHMKISRCSAHLEMLSVCGYRKNGQTGSPMLRLFLTTV